MQDNHDQLGTEWNQAQAYQYRLHLCAQDLNEARRARDFSLWEEALWSFYLELTPALEEKEQTTAEQNIHKAVNGISASNITEREVFRRFVETEKHLRVIMRKRGLLLPRRKGGKQHDYDM